LLGVAALAAALRAPVAALPFERDEGGYAYIAQRWAAGDVPYRDVFDQKPPAVFAFYAAAFAAGGETPAAVRWAAQAWIVAALAAVAAIGARLATPSAGIAAAIAGLALVSDSSWLGNAVNTEQVAVLPLALGALLALRARGAAGAFAVGALGSLALLTKPVTAPIVAFEMATLLALTPRRVASAAWALLGIAVPVLPTALYFASQGAWDALLDAVVWNNVAYAGETKLSDYPLYFSLQFRPTLLPLGPVYAAALLAPLALRGGAGAPAPRALAWLAGWLAASLLAVAAGGYFRQHYFALAMPPLALAAGIGLDAASRRLAGERRARAVAPLAALALLAWPVAVGWWYYGPATPASKLHRLYGSNPFPESPALGAWLAARSSPEDRVFVYGSEPQLLFYAQRRSASRYMYVYPLTMPLPAAAERQRELLAELDASPPRFVVGVFVRTSLLEQPSTPRELSRGLRERVERDYEVAAVVPFAADRSARILEGKPARAAWNERPLWDGATPWTAFVVWERVAPQ
jgi:4-amino-4-deoxy-L-arabinose transferase-like glycosyltransferase